MSFTTKHIKAETLCIIDVWSYKLRVCAAQFKNKKIDILAYNEKRQDITYFSNQECINLPWLCENISDAIKKLEDEVGIKLDKIVINYPFWELYLGSRTINYKRKKNHTLITQRELEDIMELSEKLCLKKLIWEVEKLYGLSALDVQILLSRVNSISIDGEPYKKIIGKQGEKMKISLLNVFIPESKHRLMLQIWNVLEKKIFRILPIEYCITKIFHQKNIVIVNVWATQTTLSVLYENEVIWISKISIWIQDLLSKISRNSTETKAEIIEKLWSQESYLKEKAEFLAVWWESFWLSLKEILGTKICPKDFFIWGGWGNNNFISTYLQKIDFSQFHIKIVNQISFLQEDLSDVFKKIKHIRIKDIERIPLDIYVMLLETDHIISKEGDAVSNSLKTAIKRLGYLKS